MQIRLVKIRGLSAGAWSRGGQLDCTDADSRGKDAVILESSNPAATPERHERAFDNLIIRNDRRSLDNRGGDFPAFAGPGN